MHHLERARLLLIIRESTSVVPGGRLNVLLHNIKDLKVHVDVLPVAVEVEAVVGRERPGLAA